MSGKFWGSLAIITLFGASVGTANAVTFDFNLETATGGDIGTATYSTTAVASPSATLNPALSEFTTFGLNGNANPVIGVATTTIANDYVTSPIALPLGTPFVVIGANTGATYAVNGATTFGFTWGSLDSANSVTVTTTLGNTYTLSASTLQGLIDQVQGRGPYQAEVYFTDSQGIASIEFDNGLSGFEIAAGIASTPLPPAMVLFGAAFGGLTWFGRRRQRQVNMA